MLTNTGDEFHLLPTKESFNEIEDSEGIIKLAYAVDNTNHNDTENNETIHSNHNLVVVLKDSIMRVAFSKCELTPQSHHYYEATVHKFKMSIIISSDKYQLMYDANQYSINTRVGNFGDQQIHNQTLLGM